MNNSNAKENIPTEQSPPGEKTRISRPHGDEERSSCLGASSGERSQTPDSAPLLKPSFTLPKRERVRKPQEFRHIYNNGKRYDGRFMSVFVLANDLPVHRLGITASRKGVGKAVFRNRAKRLLREAFRLSKIELNGLEQRYDFVLNARRNFLRVKMQEPFADLQKIIERIFHDESGKQKPESENLTP